MAQTGWVDFENPYAQSQAAFLQASSGHAPSVDGPLAAAPSPEAEADATVFVRGLEPLAAWTGADGDCSDGAAKCQPASLGATGNGKKQALHDQQPSRSLQRPSLHASSHVLEKIFGSEYRELSSEQARLTANGARQVWLSPYSRFRAIWDAIIVIAAAYTVFAVPLAVAFDALLDGGPSSAAAAVQTTVDLLLCIDVALNFQVGILRI